MLSRKPTVDEVVGWRVRSVLWTLPTVRCSSSRPVCGCCGKGRKSGYRELAGRAHFSAATLSAAAAGRKLPSLAVTLVYVKACGGDRLEWEQRWRTVAGQLAAAEQADSPPSAEQPVPYRGLACFQPQDAPWFFGRQQVVRQLLDRLAERSLLVVLGPSGVGKSSVLRAGLVPAVAGGALSVGSRGRWW